MSTKKPVSTGLYCKALFFSCGFREREKKRAVGLMRYNKCLLHPALKFYPNFSKIRKKFWDKMPKRVESSLNSLKQNKLQISSLLSLDSESIKLVLTRKFTKERLKLSVMSKVTKVSQSFCQLHASCLTFYKVFVKLQKTFFYR